MRDKFRAEIQQLDDLCYVRISGVIDEDNVLASLAPRIKGSIAVVNLAGVTEINNCGVRDWVRWRESVEAGSEVVLVECAPAMVAQLNLVGNFAGSGYVKSFHAPYYCGTCLKEKTQLVEMSQLPVSGEVTTPSSRCDECHSMMAFDDLEESYFAFVPQVRRDMPQTLAGTVDAALPKVLERAGATGVSGAVFSSGEGQTRTAASTVGGSLSSAAALRRLREKTGVRTHRPTQQPREEQEPATKSRRLPLVALLITLALVAAAAVVLLFF